MKVAERESEIMRRMLAEQGIELDRPQRPSASTPRPAPACEVDRAAIRAILAPHAPPHQLEWLVASCPSVEHAYTYQRPSTISRCATADRDDDGRDVR